MERTELKKSTSSFELIGEVQINENYTFKLETQSASSPWIYNALNLGVDCGKNGTIYCEMMGGHFSNKNTPIYVHGKKEKEEGSGYVDDYKNQWTVDWDERFDDSVYDECGNQCFIRVGIETDSNGKTFTKRFLSEYDAIKYLSEHLTNGMTVRINGNLEYSKYGDAVMAKKRIRSIYASKMTPDKYEAKFSQALLIDKDSLEALDKEKMTYTINAKVVEYLGSVNTPDGKVEIKQNVTLDRYFELDANTNPNHEKLANKLFNVKKSDEVWEVVVEGYIHRGGTTVQLTVDDLPEDIQELIELGALTEEEALEKSVDSNKSVEAYMIKSPAIRRTKEGTPVILIDKERYTVNDYVFFSEFLSNQETERVEAEEDSDDDEYDIDALLGEIE